MVHASLSVALLDQRAGVAARGVAVRGVARSLLRLFCLDRIEARLGTLLSHGALSPAAGRALPGAIQRACAELAPDALSVVDAFAIPDTLLRSALGKKSTGSERGVEAGVPPDYVQQVIGAVGEGSARDAPFSARL
jgi:hypothetical protein